MLSRISVVAGLTILLKWVLITETLAAPAGERRLNGTAKCSEK